MDKYDMAQLMKWQRGCNYRQGAFTIRKAAAGGWYVTDTLTGQTLRGPFERSFDAERAARAL